MKQLVKSVYKDWQKAVSHIQDVIQQIHRELPHHTSTTVTANYTIDGTYRMIWVDATSGNITISVENAAHLEGSFTVNKIDSSANTVTIDPAGSETINGATTRVLTMQYESISFASNQTEFMIV